jgi:tetratricopeptide (TPR) repeat protein
MRNQSPTFVTGLCLILLTISVYARVWNHEFNFDDRPYITDNDHVQAGMTFEGVAWAFTFNDVGYWHPLTWLSLMFDSQIYGLNSKMYHLNNLLFHTINTLLLFLLLKRMTGALWRSAIVAGMFALHPLNVESVAWVTERKNVLSTLFWMLTMWTFVHYVERPKLNKYLLVLLFFALGLMAKPMVATLPFVLLLLDYWPLRRFQFGKSDDKRPQINKSTIFSFSKSPSFLLIMEKVPLIAISALCIYLSSLSARHFGIVISTDLVPMKLRIANALVSYVSYIGKMIWPQDLSIFYPYPSSLPIWQSVGAGLLLVCISVMVILVARRYQYLAVGWLWYIGTLVPVIGLMQVGLWPAMADRFTYVPLIGLFIMVAWGVHDLSVRWRYRSIVLAILTGAVLSALITRTWFQLHYWQNDIKLYKHALEVTTNNFVMHNNLGLHLLEQRRFEEANYHYYEALRINPHYVKTHYNLANALGNQGKIDEAIMHYKKALQIDPKHVNAHNNLGLVFAEQGKLNEAIGQYAEALRIRPDHLGAHNNMGMALLKKGKLKEAIGHYEEALRIDSNSAEAHNNLGDALSRLGKVKDAIIHFNEALKAQPDNDNIHYNLANALVRQGKIGKAIMHYKKALQINPNHADAHNNLGIAYAQIGKIDEAIDHFTAALRSRPNFRNARSNLERLVGNKELP